MRRHGLAALILLAPLTCADAPIPGEPETAKPFDTAMVVDGDTVYTKDGTKIRLHGIDTPERDQPTVRKLLAL